MKTIAFAVICALVGINAAIAAENTNVIPSPTTLIETELLPQFKAKVEMDAKGWYLNCTQEDKLQSKTCASRSEAKTSEKPTA